MDMVLVLDNIRSAHNVGSLLRTADGLGIKQVYAAGLTPHPLQANDTRLPHIIDGAEKKLAKTALGAEKSVKIVHDSDTAIVLTHLKQKGYFVLGLEQTNNATDLSKWRPSASKLALVLGHETKGLSQEVVDQLDAAVMIPMRGQKESFNVAASGAMAMYYLLNQP